jgi:hypothetical protein
MGMIAIIVSIEFFIVQSLNVAVPALLVGIVLLSLSLLSLRSTSTPFERIFTLRPKDERESKQVEWGFALVGKITLGLVISTSVITLVVSGYALFTGDIQFYDCYVPQGSKDLACRPNAYFYFSETSIYFLAIFGLIAIASSAVAVTRKVR